MNSPSSFEFTWWEFELSCLVAWFLGQTFFATPLVVYEVLILRHDWMVLHDLTKCSRNTPEKHPHGTVKKNYTPFISVGENKSTIDPNKPLNPHLIPIHNCQTHPSRNIHPNPFVARIKTLINSPATWKSWGDLRFRPKNTSGFFVWLGWFFLASKRDRTRVDEKINGRNKNGMFFFENMEITILLSPWPTLKKLFGITCLVGKRKHKLVFHVYWLSKLWDLKSHPNWTGKSSEQWRKPWFV